jgi:predicted DNA-binding transcriptional regulator AlpA
MKSKQTTTPQLVSIAYLSAMLDISRSKLFDMRASGQLPRAIKIGRLTRWRLSDIEAWINAGCPRQEKFEALRKAGAK